jgi:phospholipase C
MAGPIKHLIVLMLENRSFDHMLGFSGIVGADGTRIDGLNREGPNPEIPDDDGKKYSPVAKANYSGDFSDDPGHDFPDVNIQLFGTKAPAAGQTPTMDGFVKAYHRGTGDADSAGNVMRCFVPEQLPVLTALARSYAVCDRWFASVPGPTLPNRLFAHAGTSKGRLDLSPDDFSFSNTVYEVLDKSSPSVSSCIYSDGWTATATFRYLLEYQEQFYGTLDDFESDCSDNDLPSYCFVEPRYSSGLVGDVFLPQNDMHPDSDVREGEELIFRIYQAIRSNRKVWESSMLVVTFDEHGGLYDHVPPPPGPAPDDSPGDSLGFDFTRLGVRVPAVIVSPYTKNLVLHQQFDHTSLIATARKMFTGKWQDDALGRRAAQANTFDQAAMNLDKPRTDHVPIYPRINLTKVSAALHSALNSLQKEHLKHALWLDGKLPQTLQLRFKTKVIKELTDAQVAAGDFKNVTEQLAEDFARKVVGVARGLSKGPLRGKG